MVRKVVDAWCAQCATMPRQLVFGEAKVKFRSFNLPEILLTALAIAGPASAQTDPPRYLADVLALGGTLIPAGELRSMINQSRWHALPNPNAVVTFSSDGTYSGSQPSGNAAIGIFGDWEISEAGELCLKPKNTRSQPICRYWYRVGNRFFGGGPPTEPQLGVGPRIKVE